jgi:hypothetical protein
MYYFGGWDQSAGRSAFEATDPPEHGRFSRVIDEK